VCAAEELRPGASIRFPLEPPRRFADEGFAHRAADGSLRAWVNVCPHRAQPIDLGDGRLFNALGQIECQAHGARFDPEVGICAAGPCEAMRLTPVPILEEDGAIWLRVPETGDDV
jgi:nitrite reductase/ring-hydroxylating ferredoxin subunit